MPTGPNHQKLVELAQRLRDGALSVEAFVAASQELSRTADVGTARVDLDRHRRCGYPEVIYGPGKAPDDVVRIAQALLEAGQTVLVTRVSEQQAAAVEAQFAEVRYNRLARTLRIACGSAEATAQGLVPVITAGTSDRPVAEEAAETLLWMGCQAPLVVDVGVAGPHRLPERLGELAGADAVVVAAGMEGALPSVVGGYLDCPIIAVPTSVGYGANFQGLSALLSMLNSCAANVAVVNIDAGFKAGYLAGLIASRASRRALQ